MLSAAEREAIAGGGGGGDLGNVIQFPDPTAPAGGPGSLTSSSGSFLGDLTSAAAGIEGQASGQSNAILDALSYAWNWWADVLGKILQWPAAQIAAMKDAFSKAITAISDEVQADYQKAKDALEAAVPGLGKYAPVILVGLLAMLAYAVFK
jgi:hypothetical protein